MVNENLRPVLNLECAYCLLTHQALGFFCMQGISSALVGEFHMGNGWHSFWAPENNVGPKMHLSGRPKRIFLNVSVFTLVSARCFPLLYAVAPVESLH